MSDSSSEGYHADPPLTKTKTYQPGPPPRRSHNKPQPYQPNGNRGRRQQQQKQTIPRYPTPNAPIHLQPAPPPKNKISGPGTGGAWARAAERVATRDDESRGRLTKAQLQADVDAALRNPEKVMGGINDFMNAGRRDAGRGRDGW